MGQMYYVWTAHGWFAKGGGFTTNPESAKLFSREEAFRFSKRHVDSATGNVNAVPVSEADFNELVTK